jgi:hypothetical protein
LKETPQNAKLRRGSGFCRGGDGSIRGGAKDGRRSKSSSQSSMS